MKKLIIPTLVMAAVVVSLVGVSAVSAQADSSQTEAPMNRAGQSIEAREAHRAEMQARSEEVLNQAIEEGLLTEEQKQTMLEMREAFRATRGEMNREAREARHEARESHRAEMQAWAAENGIDLKSICDGEHEFKQIGFGRFAK